MTKKITNEKNLKVSVCVTQLKRVHLKSPRLFQYHYNSSYEDI
jgi:hypothetical protein